jgi:hypothetical protein
MNISFVPPNHINDVWDAVEGFIAPAVKVTNGRYMLEDIHAATRKGDMQLWIAFTDEKDIIGCEVTAISEYPSRRFLTLLFTGGKELRSWRNEMTQVLLRWAEDSQCSGIEGCGREGWIKMLEPYGIKRGLIMFEKDL